MRRTATWVAGAAVLAALIAGSATASAAPTASAKASPAKASPAKVTQLTKLSRLNGQYTTLAKRAKKCPGAAPVLRSTGKQRTAAMKKARRSSVPALRAKNKRMGKAVLALAKFEGRCPPQVRTVHTVSPGPAQPGSAPGSVSFDLSTPAALNSPLVDLSPALDGGALPDDIALVSLDELTSPICSTVGAACVGVDPGALITTLEELVASAPALGPITNPLLDQVTALLEAGDIDPLFEVRRISDTVIQLVPEGPLATLAALLDDVIAQASDTVGRIQVM